jgi:hypothetical protein
MTEAEWLTCPDPEEMSWFIVTRFPHKVSGRKDRLIAIACSRLVWPLLTDWRSRRAVEVAEKFADGEASDEEFATALAAVKWSRTASPGDLARQSAQGWYPAAIHVALHLAQHHGQPSEPERKLALLMRDVLGNPFRKTALERNWTAWNDGTVPKLARAIYDDRAFDRLPILADALEDAGCENAAVLHHCREPGEHVRGCWVVDLLLEKQ